MAGANAVLMDGGRNMKRQHSLRHKRLRDLVMCVFYSLCYVYLSSFRTSINLSLPPPPTSLLWSMLGISASCIDRP